MSCFIITDFTFLIIENFYSDYKVILIEFILRNYVYIRLMSIFDVFN